jgi:hypothetical protein
MVGAGGITLWRLKRQPSEEAAADWDEEEEEEDV